MNFRLAIVSFGKKKEEPWARKSSKRALYNGGVVI